ncbi:MAG: TetR/AcrR family transcriptional regulator [Chloroflexota bacterium]
MVRPRRETHVDLAADIKRIAFRRLAELGTQGLSLRAIARELNITAPAIYNYFPRLEDLITALIVDAFTALGDALVAGRDAVAASDLVQRLRATGLAYRRWAIEHPEQYNLIFGTPIPGYEAPIAITQPAAARGLDILVAALDDAHRAGQLQLDADLLAATPGLLEEIDAWRQADGNAADPRIHYLALAVWTRVHGFVSLELGRQFPAALQDTGAIFRLELERILAECGLKGSA